MSTCTFARVSFSALIALIAVLTIAASGFTQSATQVYLPLAQQPAVTVAGDNQAVAAAKTRPTIVLVHGAWADGSSWSAVIQRLQEDGYNVIAPQFPLTSLADNLARLREVLAVQTGPTLVVGHSYGGQIITALGTDAPHVVGLGYADHFFYACSYSYSKYKRVRARQPGDDERSNEA